MPAIYEIRTECHNHARKGPRYLTAIEVSTPPLHLFRSKVNISLQIGEFWGILGKIVAVVKSEHFVADWGIYGKIVANRCV
jgi:hypothetical protein